MLKIQEKSLDWSLKHIEGFGDTDIFPVPFEFEAIRDSWDTILKKHLRDQNILEGNVRPYRRCLTPKHRYGFRVSTQLDPLDTIIFTSLVYEIGQDIENLRVPKEENVVFSSRFYPTDDGRMYDTNYNWDAFQNKCESILETEQYKYVVVADIADFYPRIYLHPLENALDACTNKNNHVKAIKSMIKSWNFNISYGIPVGQASSRLLAELTIDDIDRGLLSEGVIYCRYVDDFRIFCTSEREAHEQLALLANMLFENHGLTLQQHKTRIMSEEEFKTIFLKQEIHQEIDNLSNKFYEIFSELEIDDPYEEIDLSDLSEELRKEIDELNLIDILEEQINGEGEIDTKLVVFILRRLGQLNNTGAIQIVLNNIDKLYTVFKQVIIYINQVDIGDDLKKDIGLKIINFLDSSLGGHLEYHRMWLLNTFTKDESWNNKSKFVPLYNQLSDEFTRRKLILAMGRSHDASWFKRNKRNIDQFSAWQKRAFLAAVSSLPGDEAEHWYRSISRGLDPLEKAIIEWVKKNRF